MFHVGEISYETAAGFDCADSTLWNSFGTDSLSGVSNAKYTLKYPGLFNTEGEFCCVITRYFTILLPSLFLYTA